MKFKILIALFSSLLLISLLFSGCSGNGKLGQALSIQEQPSIEIEEPAKIYPSQVGDVLIDAKVDIPAITEFMEKYNAAAKDSYSKINYDYVRYNQEQDYYYVNDTESSRGIKFKLDKSNNIISASVYSGNINDKQTNLLDMVSIAAQTMGYKNVMSTSDKSRMNSIINSYNSAQGTVSSSVSMFGDMDLSVNLDNLFVSVDLPAMPESYNDEDISNVNQNANSVITGKQDENSSNPAVSGGTDALDIGDEYESNYQSQINEKLKDSFGEQGETTITKE